MSGMCKDVGDMGEEGERADVEDDSVVVSSRCLSDVWIYRTLKTRAWRTVLSVHTSVLFYWRH